MRRLLGIGIGLAVAQHFTGVNTIVYYGTTVLEATGLGASASIVATVTLGMISVIGVIVGIILLGKIDRRTAPETHRAAGRPAIARPVDAPGRMAAWPQAARFLRS